MVHSEGTGGRPTMPLVSTDIRMNGSSTDGGPFRLLVDAVVDYAIFLLDSDGRITSWNRGAERIKGYRREEVIGRSFEEFFTPEDRADGLPARILAEARREGRVEHEGWRVRKDGSRFWADAILTALHDDLGELAGFAKVTRDLTDRRAAEEAARQLAIEQQARAVAEDALQVKDRVLGIASHELKTPIAGIQLAVDALAKEQRAGDLSSERAGILVERLRVASERLSDLVVELLDVSRMNSDVARLKPAPVNLSQLIDDVVARFSDVGHTRVRSDAPEGLTLVADATRLDQVLSNLVDNALKYSSEPSEVVVSASVVGDKVQIEVADAGIGVDVAAKDRFVAFERGANAENVPGMGLGLFISRQIVERHGGEIELVPRMDGAAGTTARVRLPLRGPKAGAT